MLKYYFIALYVSLYFSVGCCALTYRLNPSKAVPRTYEIVIKPDLDNDVFHGQVIIYVVTKESLNGITLHSDELNITDVYINQIKGRYVEETEGRITVKYNNGSIQPGEHTLLFKYSGNFQIDSSRQSRGLVKALYDYNGTEKYVYVTDLEPNWARKVFPCFDEPQFKAKYHIKLVSPNETYVAISNMPEITKFRTSYGIVHEFAASVPMSTYLVSFAFTNFPYYSETFEDKGRQIPIRIFTVNASKENNEFAMQCAKTAFLFYSNYTDISYPLPKLDMIEYQRVGTSATENWGLITFRQGLLTAPLEIYNEFQIKLVMFHELSHFWFGNLVTNAWWNDIWLQEGFASYMSYKLSAHVNNETQLGEMKAFQFTDFFEKEIYKKSQPIVQYLPDSSKIDDVFLGLVYEKASAILLMLEDQVGQEKFREIIKKFLNKYAYHTATTNDFITVVEEVVPDIPLRTFLESYLYQHKFPVLNVDIVDSTTYVITQQVCETFHQENISATKWTIPISYRADYSNDSKHIWFHREMDELRLEESNAKWIIFNPEGNQMYKTIWSTNLWNKIISNIEFMDYSTTDTVISDALYSFQFNKIKCETVIHLMKRFGTGHKERWELFFPLYDHLKENLFCHKYTEESKLLWKFQNKRYAETNHKQMPKFREPESCDDKSIIQNEVYRNNLGECATWIRKNLKE
ncbi:glutamyl aminopeptidase-like isoform X2 [Diabrotica virgifera virgifera]|uniref:Aminopeptidase n=1 Tax=Diabrotica virgifera virgifera TaxID=50390 RepID=A0ABM5JU73_DIAVI|nr:glutamyl aminopeptidase-like isoform X2 [Diabrotica virgifera virgifera]